MGASASAESMTMTVGDRLYEGACVMGSSLRAPAE